MPSTEEQVRLLVQEMYLTGESAPFDIRADELRGRGRRQSWRFLDVKLVALAAAVVALVVVGLVAASNGAPHRSTAAGPTTTTSSSVAGSISVPSLVGRTQAQASNVLDHAGLKLGSYRTVANSQVVAGVVISQEPAPGVLVRPGATIDLVLSTGQPNGTGSTMVAVPNTVNDSQVAAGDTLGAAGLNVGTLTVMGSSQIAAGDVIGQDPAPGTEVAPGSSVNLVISKGT
jgi:hypothetical protein